MTKLGLIILLSITSLHAFAKADHDVKFALCSGNIFNDSKITDKGQATLRIEDGQIIFQADTVSLKNFKRIYPIIDGKPGWIDSDDRIRDAHIYGQLQGDVKKYTDEMSVTELGYNQYSDSTAANVRFDTSEGVFYGTLDCTEVK